MEANKVSVRIYGHEYVLTGEKSRDHMIRVAAYVDTKIHEVAAGFKNGSSTALAVLSAVNIADEYFSVMDRVNESKITNEQMEGDIHRYEQLWEEAKKSLTEHKEESRRIYEEKEALAERFHTMEREMEEALRQKDRDVQETLQLKEREASELLHQKEREASELLRQREREFQEAIFEKELMIEELTQSSENVEAQAEKDSAQLVEASESKYKDLENNIFDLQMENIQLKSEVEKLRSISE
jgi:cell division protein ZapA